MPIISFITSTPYTSHINIMYAGLPGHAVYGKTRNCGELLVMERGSADVAGLTGFFSDFVDDVKDLKSEALKELPSWFRDDVPVREWEGITADDKGRISAIDVRVADPNLLGGECRLPNLKVVSLCYTTPGNDEEQLNGVELTTAYLRSLGRAHPDVDISCGGKLTLTPATFKQRGIGAALSPFAKRIHTLELQSAFVIPYVLECIFVVAWQLVQAVSMWGYEKM